MLSTRRRFLSEGDDYDPGAEYEQFEQDDNYLSATEGGAPDPQAGHDPGLWLEPKKSHMLERRGGGGGFSLGPDPEKTQAKIETVEPAGGETQDAVVSRMEASQWGTEDPDSDRVAPGSIQASTDKNSKPEKPPGPDSPSADYKKGSKFLGNPDLEKQQKAYDEEFGPGKKHKWYSLESTAQWNRRREDTARDLEMRWRRQTASEELARRETPRAIGHQALNGPDGKKRLYAIFNDGTSTVVAEGLDEAAKRRYLNEGITWDKQTGHGYKQRQDGTWERQDVPAPGAPAEIGPQAGMIGPTGPENMAPIHGGEAVRARYFNVPANTDVYKDEGGTVSKVASGQPRAASPGRASTKDPETELDKEVVRMVDARLRANEKYQKMHPRAQAEFRKSLIDAEKKERRAARGKGGPEAAGDDNLTVMKYD